MSRALEVGEVWRNSVVGPRNPWFDGDARALRNPFARYGGIQLPAAVIPAGPVFGHHG